MKMNAFLDRLEGVRARGANKWSARCPAHNDTSPSLSVAEAGEKILIHCFSGCAPLSIMEAVGLTMGDLFIDSLLSQGQRLTPKRQKLDLVAVAHRFELAALDRRLRADEVLKAVAGFSGDGIEDQERDRLMNVVARAYADRDRAEFLETVADDFRLKAFEERIASHAA